MYTILIQFLNISADVQTNLIDPHTDVATLTPAEISDRVYGSKSVLVVESMMCTVQWGTKACLLMLYWRLTEHLRESLMVKLTAVYVFLTYCVMMGLYYGYWCRPFSAFWETPTPNIQCATQTHHLIVNTVFNLSADMLIILIPLPLFMRAQLSTRKRLLLVFPFSLGFFTMACASLSKHLSFTQPFSGDWVFWYCREASTAMIVANVPYGWTIVRKVFKVKAFLRRGSSNELIGNSYQTHPASFSVTSPVTEKGHLSIAVSSISDRTRLLSLFSGRRSGPQRLSSELDYRQRADYHIDAMNRDFNPPTSLTHAGGSSGNSKTTPLSSVSSNGSTIQRPGNAHIIDAIDRLYDLDDASLEMGGRRRSPVHYYEPYAK